MAKFYHFPESDLAKIDWIKQTDPSKKSIVSAVYDLAKTEAKRSICSSSETFPRPPPHYPRPSGSPHTPEPEALSQRV